MQTDDAKFSTGGASMQAGMSSEVFRDAAIRFWIDGKLYQALIEKPDPTRSEAGRGAF